MLARLFIRAMRMRDKHKMAKWISLRGRKKRKRRRRNKLLWPIMVTLQPGCTSAHVSPRKEFAKTLPNSVFSFFSMSSRPWIVIRVAKSAVGRGEWRTFLVRSSFHAISGNPFYLINRKAGTSNQDSVRIQSGRQSHVQGRSLINVRYDKHWAGC